MRLCKKGDGVEGVPSQEIFSTSESPEVATVLQPSPAAVVIWGSGSCCPCWPEQQEQDWGKGSINGNIS